MILPGSGTSGARAWPPAAARGAAMPGPRGRGGEVDAGAQRGAQVGRHLRLRVLEIDDGVAVDHGQARLRRRAGRW